MITFIGDISCRLDSKGRVAIPSAFRKKMRDELEAGFVLQKDMFDNLLVLYPMKEWEQRSETVRNRTSQFNKQHVRFVRIFTSGTLELYPDSAHRILIPRRFLDMVGIKDEAVFAGQAGKIEIFSPSTYEDFIAGKYQPVSKEAEEFEKLMQEILEGQQDKDSGE